jgi:hypothetical protein
MSLHETHQISFERYLRKKMTVQEKSDFEEKLSADDDFKASFLHYKLHRKAYLTELFEDYDTEFKSKSHRTHLIYTLVTIIFMLTSVFFYFDNKQLRKQVYTIYLNSAQTVYRTIPFITGDKNVPPANEKNNVENYTDNAILSELPASKTIVEVENILKKDVLIKDSMHFVSRYTKLYDLDSLVIDSSTQQHIKYWQSPIGFEGYKYDGRVLNVFGIETTDTLSILQERHVLWLLYNQELIKIENDNNHHKF